MVHVVALITTFPGKRETVLTEFRKIVPLVHAEQGCIEYQPVVDNDSLGDFQSMLGEDSFMVIEKWDTAADLDAHSKAPHMQAYGAAVSEFLADRKIHVLANT